MNYFMIIIGFLDVGAAITFALQGRYALAGVWTGYAIAQAAFIFV